LTNEFILGFLTGLGTRFVGDRLEELYQWSKDRFGNKNIGSEKISSLKFPQEIRIDNWYKVSVTYRGNGKSAFFSCRIQDSLGNYCWYGDYNKSIKRGLDERGQYFETGMLNLKNGSSSSEWDFKADSNLKPGKGNLIVGVFEMKDSVDIDGQTKQFRPHITLESREILLM
jgi:hypothetical protein